MSCSTASLRPRRPRNLRAAELAVDAGVDEALASDVVEPTEVAFVEAARRSARAAGVGAAPTVLVDGKRFGSGDGVELADQLQRKILAD